MTMTRSQIERLGVRLVRSRPPAPDDLSALHGLLVTYGDALAEAVGHVHDELGIAPSARVKTTGTILEKLDRYGGSWLKSIQDIAGMRIISSDGRRGQDAIVARLVEASTNASHRPKIVDRRVDPSYGYRAVHLIVVVKAVPVEIQVGPSRASTWRHDRCLRDRREARTR